MWVMALFQLILSCKCIPVSYLANQISMLDLIAFLIIFYNILKLEVIFSITYRPFGHFQIECFIRLASLFRAQGSCAMMTHTICVRLVATNMRSEYGTANLRRRLMVLLSLRNSIALIIITTNLYQLLAYETGATVMEDAFNSNSNNKTSKNLSR